MLANRSSLVTWIGFEKISSYWSAQYFFVFVGHDMGSKFTETNRTWPNYQIGPNCVGRNSWFYTSKEGLFYPKQSNISSSVLIF